MVAEGLVLGPEDLVHLVGPGAPQLDPVGDRHVWNVDEAALDHLVAEADRLVALVLEQRDGTGLAVADPRGEAARPVRLSAMRSCREVLLGAPEERGADAPPAVAGPDGALRVERHELVADRPVRGDEPGRLARALRDKEVAGGLEVGPDLGRELGCADEPLESVGRRLFVLDLCEHRPVARIAPGPDRDVQARLRWSIVKGSGRGGRIRTGDLVLPKHVR